MNQAHLHLIIVHIPIVLVPAALILYLIGYSFNSRALYLVALNTFVFAAITSSLAFLLGEGAEEIVEGLSGIAESAIESHEESASLALWLTIALGVTSLANLISLKYKMGIARLFTLPVVFISVLSSGALSYTAHEGGKIRHPEAFENNLSYTKSMKYDSDDD